MKSLILKLGDNVIDGKRRVCYRDGTLTTARYTTFRTFKLAHGLHDKRIAILRLRRSCESSPVVGCWSSLQCLHDKSKYGGLV